MRIKRYVVGAALIALAVGYYLYRKKSDKPASGNGKGSRRKAASALKKAVSARAHAR
ncbi:MAG: hypothetical protein HY924_10995 [Elusimicrobia bacterium]|nr:hypothetical protein [Elusimicrobiota bacterium]